MTHLMTIRFLLVVSLFSLAPIQLRAAPDLSVVDGFEISLVAGADLVERPICADFDDRGRLYVAESSGSNEKVAVQLEKRPHRILRLEDVDGDGVFDRRVVFADKMMLPQGILWHDGAIYCGAPPSIWKLEDSTGDGVADKREEWWKGGTLTGCANDVHGPYLGPDGFLYWCKGAFARQTHRLPRGRRLDDSAAHIYRSRPDGSGFDSFLSGGMDNPVEIAWDAGGNLFFTTTFFSHPRDGKRDAIVHGVYGGVYPKVHGVIDGLVRTGELMPAMTSLGPAAPCGLCCYQGASFGAEFRGNLFCCQFNTHKVSRHILKSSGSTFTTLDFDFVTSDDPDFHPTDVLEDRDGSLLIIDTGGWYKLCCPTSQIAKPEVPGAIYRVRRIAPAGAQDPPKMTVGQAAYPTDPIVNLARDSAQLRLSAASALAQQPDPAAVPALLAAARTFVDRHLEHAIVYALILIADRDATALGLASENVHVRRAALIALDQMDAGGVSRENLRAALDSAEPILTETAWWIYESRPERGGELVEFFEHHPEEITHLGKLGKHPALRPVLIRWINSALASREETRVREALPILRMLGPESRIAYQDDLATISRDETVSNGLRIDAVELLNGTVPRDLFLFLHGQRDPRGAVLVARMDLDPAQREAILKSIQDANPLQLPHLLKCFRADSDEALGHQILAALRASTSFQSLRLEEIDQAMENFPEEIRRAARDALSERKRLLTDPARLDKIADELPVGDPARGHVVFNSAKAACFSCHAIGYRGGDFGPGLSQIGSIRTERDLLEAIVFPSASFVRSYEPVVVTVHDHAPVLGIISDRKGGKLSLRIAPGVPEVEIPQESIEAIAAVETSLMPAGLDQQLDRQELADLVAFLKSMR